MEPLVRSACRLGEGPLYDPRRRALFWLDILDQRLWRHDLTTGEAGAVALGAQVSAMALRAGGAGFAAVAREGAGVLDPDTGAFALKSPAVWDPVGQRSNDGHAGPDGAFWFGVMANEGGVGGGALYRLAPNWQIERVVAPWGIPNTMQWSADGETLFAADSAINTMFALRMEYGAVRETRPLYRAPHDVWTPDGSALDAQGCLWTARWDGAAIVRHDPNGVALQTIAMPTPRPTSCAFGGDDLRTLFITSARDGVEDAPFAGDLFALDAGVAGAPAPVFGG